MPVNLSIKNVPDELVARLKERAKQNHRSLQGELMFLLDRSLRKSGSITLEEIVMRNQECGFSAPSESAQLVREDRDR